jgi:hypothetical protein
MAQEKHSYNEAGRKLKAAITSSLLRRKGVDRTLKEMPEIVGHDWVELAERLMRDMNAQVVEQLVPTRKGPVGIQ